NFEQCLSELKAPMARSNDLQQQMSEMKQQMDFIIQNQQLMLQKQDQTLDRLVTMQRQLQAILTATYELHEFPIPRLFIILPKDTSAWDRYGKYMLTLQEMIKYGVTIAGFAVPALAAVSAPGAIDMFQNSLNTISQSAVNQSIEYLQSLSSKDPQEQDAAKAESFTGQEALEGADLRHLEAFIKAKDQHRALGNLYRIVTQQGHVKWVCINHYRLVYKEQDQQAFATAVELNGGHYDPHLGKVMVRLGSKIQTAGFFDALAKARRVDELVVMFDWEGTTSDLEAFGDTLKSAAVVSISDGEGSLGRKGLRRLEETLKTDSTLTTLSLEYNSIGDNGAVALSEAVKVNSTLTTLHLDNNSIGENGAVALFNV
ncbi:hypothetical protein BGX29_004177, partial [Mortierella sp. GBA35]